MQQLQAVKALYKLLDVGKIHLLFFVSPPICASTFTSNHSFTIFPHFLGSFTRVF